MSVSSILGSVLSSLKSPPALQTYSGSITSTGVPQTIHTFIITDTTNERGVWILSAFNLNTSGSYTHQLVAVSDTGVPTLATITGFGDVGSFTTGVSGNSITFDVGGSGEQIRYSLVKLC